MVNKKKKPARKTEKKEMYVYVHTKEKDVYSSSIKARTMDEINGDEVEIYAGSRKAVFENIEERIMDDCSDDNCEHTIYKLVPVGVAKRIDKVEITLIPTQEKNEVKNNGK